jgi:hypothetical protein
VPTYPDQVRAAERATVRKRRRQSFKVAGMAALRVAELNREFTDRYGGEILPPDDAGRDDVSIMLHHLAQRSGYPLQRMAEWLDRRAPWLTGQEREGLVTRIAGRPLKFKADTLARKIGLTAERRARLLIHTIGAVDDPAAARAERRRVHKLEVKRKMRRERGCRTRDDIAHASVTAAAPWKGERISRATWYRHNRAPG